MLIIVVMVLNLMLIQMRVAMTMTMIMIMMIKLMIRRADSGIVHPSSSSPFGHWGIVSHLKRSSLEDGDGFVDVDTNVDDQGEKEDKDCNEPDCSHRKEFASLVLLRSDI